MIWLLRINEAVRNFWNNISGLKKYNFEWLFCELIQVLFLETGDTLFVDQPALKKKTDLGCDW